MLAHSSVNQFPYNIYANEILNYRLIIHVFLFQLFITHSELCLCALIQSSKDALKSPGMSIL